MANRDGLVILGLVGVVGALVLGAFVAGVSVGKNRSRIGAAVPRQTTSDRLPAPSAPSSAGQSATTEAVVSTSPEEVISAFATNSVAARDWLKDKKVRMTYQVSNVGNNMFGGDRVAVDFTPPSESFSHPSVEFWFDGSFRSKVGSLKEGESVTVEGTFKDEEFGGDVKFEGTDLNAA